MEHLYPPTCTHTPLRDHQERGRRKVTRARGHVELDYSNILDMTETLPSWTDSSCGCLHKTCKRSRQMTFQHKAEVTSWAHTPNWGILHGWCLLGEGVSLFFKGLVPGRLTSLKQWSQHPLNWVIMNKTKQRQDMKWGVWGDRDRSERSRGEYEQNM